MGHLGAPGEGFHETPSSLSIPKSVKYDKYYCHYYCYYYCYYCYYYYSIAATTATTFALDVVNM